MFLFRLLLSFCVFSSICLSSNSLANANTNSNNRGPGATSASSSSVFPPLPITYTIAGSDSGGGAGIQADLLTMKDMGCHGCSAITCLTAQSSVGVTDVFTPPPSFLEKQLDTILDDLPPKAIKIGMLGSKELAEVVGRKLKNLVCEGDSNKKVWVVLDPVMISTSGHKLIDDDAKNAMIEHVFPHTDILTPNKFEAEALLGRKLESIQDVEEGARELLKMGVKSVLIKGGHASENTATFSYAQDYFLSSELLKAEDERICDGNRGVWIRTPRYDTEHTHGTGCTLSSAIASALALGQQRREMTTALQQQNHQQKYCDGYDYEGATSAIQLTDACCLAKAYVTAGIHAGVGLGKGPGPVRHTEFPSSHRYFPSIAINPDAKDDDPVMAFQRMRSASSSSTTAFTKTAGSNDKDKQQNNDDDPKIGSIMPIVDTFEWVEELCNTPGVIDIQLRIKDETDPEKIYERCKTCQEMCKKSNVRLWINDHWDAAIRAKCFGVHIGQEDLLRCVESGALEQLRQDNIALGISTHSYGELSACLGIKPTYISLGPVFATSSKKVKFDPQGLETVSKWRQLIPPDIPLLAIGGIQDAEIAKRVKEAGADCVAVIGAITGSKDVASAVAELNDAMA